MDRFTTKQMDGTYHVYDVGIIQEINCCDENNKNWLSLYEGAVIDKLGQYEDTGLTPQEIEQMKARMPLHQWAGESPEKISIFGVTVKKIMEWAEAEKNSNRVLNDIANSVEEKMMYMCGCRNCIEKVKMIIKGEVKPIENQCKYCKLECDARST